MDCEHKYMDKIKTVCIVERGVLMKHAGGAIETWDRGLVDRSIDRSINHVDQREGRQMGRDCLTAHLAGSGKNNNRITSH